MRKPFYSKPLCACGVLIAAAAFVLLPGCSGTSQDGSESAEPAPHVQESPEPEDEDSDLDYDRHNNGSSSLGGTTTTLDDGTVMTYDDDGTIYYENPDGSLEVTDGWGNVVKDVDGDGMADSCSIDGGESWGYL